jgi:hypothetical protein
MKSAVLLATCCLTVVSYIHAQTDTTLSETTSEVYFMGGPSYPYLPSETREIWKKGWNAGVGYGYSFKPGPIGYGAVYASVEYSRFTFNDAGYRAWLLPQYPSDHAATIQQGGLSARGPEMVLTASLNFKGAFSSSRHSIAPYFLAGVGFMYYQRDSAGIQGTTLYTMKSQHQSTFTWSVGVGIEAPLIDPVAIFVQAKTVLGVFDDPRQFFPVSGGLRIRL